MFSSEIMLASSSTRYLLVYFHTADEAFGWWRSIVVRVTVSLGFELASLTVSNVERTFCGASLCECFSCKGATSGEGMFVLQWRFREAWVTLAYGYIQACIYTAIFGFPLWYLITLIDSESACFWIAFLKWSISYFIFFRHRHLAIPCLTVQTQLAGCRGFAYQLYSERFNFICSQHIIDAFLFLTLCPWPRAADARFLGYVFHQQCVRCDLH